MPQTSAGRPWRFHSRISTGFPMTCRRKGALDALGLYHVVSTCIPESKNNPMVKKNTYLRMHTQDTLRCHVWIVCTSRKSKVSPDGICRFLSSWMDSFVSRKPVSSFSTLQTWPANSYKCVWKPVAWSSLEVDTTHATHVRVYLYIFTMIFARNNLPIYVAVLSYAS